MMKLLYVGDKDIFSRHELGFIAALTNVGSVRVVDISSSKGKVIELGSDSGVRTISIYPSVMLESLVSNCDAIFVTPRKPLLEVLRHLLKKGEKPSVSLRLWSIRAAKLRDNLRFRAYEDILIFLPSVLANATYIAFSNFVLTVDHATYVFARKVYKLLASKIYKLYPPYGYVVADKENPVDKEIREQLKDIRDSYILGFTNLNKKGAYLKFEAKPHAIVFYRIAKRLREVPVVVAGSTIEDWRRVFPQIEPPKNLHLIGRGFSDNILETLYRKARSVIVPITNRNISNRFLESLFFGKPIVTSEIARLIHPELEHGRHLYISSWDRIVDDAIKVANDEYLLENLAEGAKEAYARMFSTKINVLFVEKMLH